MSLDLIIRYRDPARPDRCVAFAGNSTLRAFWRPAAARLGLPTLGRLEALHVADRGEAARLVAELAAVADGLRAGDRLGESPESADYLLDGLAHVLPALRACLAEWDAVEAVLL